MARRLEDDALLLDACQTSFSSLWRASTAAERLGLAEESLALAQRLGNERACVVSACLRAVVYGELGRPAEMFEAAEMARREAERLRIHYGLLVIDNLLLPWLAMAGRFEESRRPSNASRRSTPRSRSTSRRRRPPARSWWSPRGAVKPPRRPRSCSSMEGGPFPISATVVSYLWRAVRRTPHVPTTRLIPSTSPPRTGSPCSTGEWPRTSRCTWTIRRWRRTPTTGLLPFAGYSCCAGSGNHAGPVDLFLALAAAARGDRDLAARHAEDAERLCAQWQIPLAAQWLRGQRDRYGF